MALFRRRAAPAPSYDDDGSLTTMATAYDVIAGDATAVSLLPEGQPVLVRQVFSGVAASDLDALAQMAAEEGWGALSCDDAGRAVLRSTRLVTPLSAAQQRARMTGIAHRLAVSYDGWEAAVPPAEPPAVSKGRRGRGRG